MSKKQSGFTLVELIVVVSILSILVLIAVPVYLSNREAAWKSSCYANLRILNGAIQIYKAQNGSLPMAPINSWSADSDFSNTIVDPDFDENDLVPYYIKKPPFCPKGGIYVYNSSVDLTTEFCSCSYEEHNREND